MPSRRTVLAWGLLAAVLRPWRTLAQASTVVEAWGEAVAGTHGVPPGWKPYETPFGRPAYDFTVVDDEGRRGLRMRSVDEHSTIAREIRVDLAVTPVLRWEWKVVTFPAGADLRAWRTTDATAHLFVIWPRFPALLRSRLIGYVWDVALPAGSIVKSRKTGTVTFVVVRSGTEARGRWLGQERNVVEDYRRIFGEEPEAPKALALSIDTNDTHGSAEALVGPIAFVAP